ncbi:MAG: sulfatase [Polyangiaceae bacterium]
MPHHGETLASVRHRLGGWWVDAVAVVVAWAGCSFAENAAVGLLWRDQFSGSWEIELGRRIVVPVAIALLAPISVVACLVFRGAQRAARDRRAAVALALAGAALAGVLGYGVTGGRHFASWGWRAPFLGFLVALGAVALGFGLPLLLRVLSHPVALAAFGIALTSAAWIADSTVLLRLYPSLHTALFGGLLFGAAMVAFALRGDDSPSPATLVGCAAVTAVLVLDWASVPREVRALEQRSNLRIALVEHAPIAGRAVEVVSALRWRDPVGWRDPGGRAPAQAEEIARTLDWSGHDIVLLSIDALRADHVSGYGYARPTTPNIDALAREGTLFDSAYCPTPHTSYSVTSMLTGKYMRPLLALGLGADSETWAQHLRRYDYRTAAFYPPAVFFIDEEHFHTFENSRLGFEYAKVEFADPALREQQVDEYLRGAPEGAALFLWVHFFEPHEPYVVHPGHVFTGGMPPEIDAYDSEVAEADDGVGRIVRLVRARRPGAVFIVTADHGEEFGEHGGRYHGTTVYEEQVHVPLVVAGPGVRRGAREASVVQTIDLLPTVLSAVGIPRPARVRGRDLGPLLASSQGGPLAAKPDVGFAFAETDDYALIAAGDVRLVCERRAAACALYRPADDPLERHDLASAQAARFGELRAGLRSVELEFGRYERGDGRALPEALRRGLQGEVDAAVEVASLLDDADVAIRRKAGEVCFELRSDETRAALRRALARDEDEDVRRWSRLALVRLGDELPETLDGLRRDAVPAWRRRAALARAERGDGTACDELGAWWGDLLPPTDRGSGDGEPPRLLLDLGHLREILAAAGKARCKTMVSGLVRGLADVRARPYVADVLGVLGDDRARAPLLALLSNEQNVTSRTHEARALLDLGERSWAGTGSSVDVHAKIAVPRGVARALVLMSDPAATLDVTIDGAAMFVGSADAPVRSIDLPAGSGPTVRFDARATGGTVVAIWVVPAGPT